MSDTESLVSFAEKLILQNDGTFCSELQRDILVAALQIKRKTYGQIAKETGYSVRYIKQDVAPKLWKLISQILNQRVTKANVRVLLENEMQIVLSKPVKTPSTEQPTNTSHKTILSEADPDIKAIEDSSILLITDRSNQWNLLSTLLKEQGYQIQQTINETLVLQNVTSAQPDLILLDTDMPDIDGYVVCQQLKADPKTHDIPVIFISELEQTWDKVKAFSVGGSDYISKPFKVLEVLARIEYQLKVKQLQRQLKLQNAKLRSEMQELQRLVALDEQTQVASRRHFDIYLWECWQQSVQEQTTLTLILAQVDNFNCYGAGDSSAAGDQCLAQVAQVLLQAVQGSNDVVSRYGLVTFAILLPETPTPEKLGQELQQAVNAVGQTLSMGLVTARPTSEMGLQEFLLEGDRALQQAKASGNDSLHLETL